jgi:hypothetical protein
VLIDSHFYQHEYVLDIYQCWYVLDIYSCW